jgi:hypothetical protein
VLKRDVNFSPVLKRGVNFSPVPKRGASVSPGLKWLLLLLLVVSLGWKSTIRIDYSSNLEDKIRSFLVRNHFIVTVSEELIRDHRTFRASRPACQMLVTEISPRGWEREAMNSRATPMEQVFVVFGGKIYAERPIWLTASDFLWHKVLSEVGLKVRPSPLLAVIATKSCGAERLPWYELASAEPVSK